MSKKKSKLNTDLDERQDDEINVPDELDAEALDIDLDTADGPLVTEDLEITEDQAEEDITYSMGDIIYSDDSDDDEEDAQLLLSATKKLQGDDEEEKEDEDEFEEDFTLDDDDPFLDEADFDPNELYE